MPKCGNLLPLKWIYRLSRAVVGVDNHLRARHLAHLRNSAQRQWYALNDLDNPLECILKQEQNTRENRRMQRGRRRTLLCIFSVRNPHQTILFIGELIKETPLTFVINNKCNQYNEYIKY